jgi:hypothetical protein
MFKAISMPLTNLELLSTDLLSSAFSARSLPFRQFRPISGQDGVVDLPASLILSGLYS